MVSTLALVQIIDVFGGAGLWEGKTWGVDGGWGWENSRGMYRDLLILIGVANFIFRASGPLGRTKFIIGYFYLFLASPWGISGSVKVTCLWGEKTICGKSLTIYYLQIAPAYDDQLVQLVA